MPSSRFEATLAVPSVDLDNPAPRLPFYPTDPLETHGGGDAFVAKAPKDPVRPNLDLDGVAPGGQAH